MHTKNCGEPPQYDGVANLLTVHSDEGTVVSRAAVLTSCVSPLRNGARSTVPRIKTDDKRRGTTGAMRLPVGSSPTKLKREKGSLTNTERKKEALHKKKK